MSEICRKFLVTLIGSVILLGSLIVVASEPGLADVTETDNLSSVSSPQIMSGLGFQVDLSSSAKWQFDAASQALASEVRFQAGWNGAYDMSGNYLLDQPGSVLTTVLGYAAAETPKLNTVIIAAYGPPYSQQGTYTATGTLGTNVLTLNSVTGITAGQCCVLLPSGTSPYITNKHSYAGGLIIGVDTANKKITLASNLTANMTGVTVRVNSLLYPPATLSATDTSVLAYCGYAQHLANSIHSSGIGGTVELWNEPPWGNDPWDNLHDFYDPSVATFSDSYFPNFSFANVLSSNSTYAAPTGVSYDWGGSEKSGGNSLVASRIVPYLPGAVPYTKAEAAQLSSEAYHPYGNSPEATAWDPIALAAATNNAQINAAVFTGIDPSGNTRNARWSNLQDAKLTTNPFMIGQNITETGCFTNNQDAKARFVSRQFLTFQSLGITPINFFKLYGSDAATGEFTFTTYDGTTVTHLQNYISLYGLMHDVAQINAAPLSYTQSNLPSITSYSGTYPLAYTSVVGRHSTNDARNSMLLAVWQRSYAPLPPNSLSATGGAGTATLTWANTSGSKQYHVKRWNPTTQIFTEIATVNPGTTTSTYTDTGLTNGTTYNYVVTSDIGVYTDTTNTTLWQSTNSNEVAIQASASTTSTQITGNQAPAYFDTFPTINPGIVNITIPAGYTATSAWNLTNRQNVPISVTGSQVTLSVGDDAVFIDLEPMFFNADFGSDTVNAAPSTAAYPGTGTTATKPTAISTGASDTLTVVTSLDALSKPVKMTSASSNYLPQLQFVAPNTTTLASNRQVVLTWDWDLNAYTPVASGQEALATARIYTNGGTKLLGVKLVAQNTSSGSTYTTTYGLYVDPGNGQNSVPVVLANHTLPMKVILDLDAQTYTVVYNGTPFAVSKAWSMTSVQGVVFEDGGALGGGSGTFTAGIDNVKISSGIPESSTASL